MVCPQCRHENPLTAKFCNNCGTRLDLVCPACGTRGTVVLGYGPSASQEDAAVLAALEYSPSDESPGPGT